MPILAAVNDNGRSKSDGNSKIAGSSKTDGNSKTDRNGKIDCNSIELRSTQRNAEDTEDCSCNREINIYCASAESCRAERATI